MKKKLVLQNSENSKVFTPIMAIELYIVVQGVVVSGAATCSAGESPMHGRQLSDCAGINLRRSAAIALGVFAAVPLR